MNSALPKPRGFKVLVKMFRVPEKVGMLYRPESERELEDTANIVAEVVALGEDAYKDDVRFPSGPRCKVGDFVLFRSYSGTRMKIGDEEYRLINDDTVEATVDDPETVKRV